MQSFDLGRRFPLVVTPFRTFQHLVTVREQLTCLESVNRHLVDGGRFILDVFNPSISRLAEDGALQESDDEPEFTLKDGRRVQRRQRTVSRDYFQQIQDIELIYDVAHPDGQRERLVHRFLMRYFFRFEAEHLLARCGFEVEAVYADYDRSPYGSKPPPGELVFVVRKT